MLNEGQADKNYPKDWANPSTRELIHVYPEIPEDGVIREFWHAQKWRKNMDFDILSPMYDAGVAHYYVNEVSCLRDGRFVIPIRWVMFRGKVYADAFSVTLNEQVESQLSKSTAELTRIQQDEAAIMDEKTIRICCTDLKENYFDLEQAGQIPTWGASAIKAGHPTRMPNPKRIIAAGRPLYSSFIDYFSDDVSGNRSKSWNKHWNTYMTHKNLPRTLLQQEFHVHFVSTSPNASVSEQFWRHTEPVEVRDELGNTTCFSLYVNAGCSDNPMQSEIAAHIGGKGNCFCRKSRVGGTQKQKATNEGYTLFLRYSHAPLHSYLQMRKDEPNRTVEDIQGELIQWSIDNRDKIYSPFLQMKVGALSIHAIRSSYIMQYAGSLIGRQFKTIAQTNIFHVRGLVSDVHFQAWRAMGELSALLWFPEIRNLAEYRRDLKVAVGNVLDIFGTVDPSKIITKIKYHLLVHTDDDVVEFGPLVSVITEIFEAYNGVFRQCSVLSNHLAPSRDIARQLADQEGLKHRLTGGWWCSTVGRQWVRAGDGIRGFLVEHPILQALVGWTEPKLVKPGIVLFHLNFPLLWLSHSRALNYGQYAAESEGYKCENIASESLDDCVVGSWVFATSPTVQNSTISGRIADILANDVGEVLVILELFQVLSSRDEIYGMPVVVRRDSEEIFSIVPGKSIKFEFNVQHDCETAKCDASGDLLAPIPLFPDREQKHHELAAELQEKQDQQLAKRKAATKRKRSERNGDEEDDDGDADEERPKKKLKKAASRPKTAKAVQRAPAAGLLVANRTKRTIRQTEKSKAMSAPDSEEESDGDTSDSDEPEDLYDSSDSDYSD
ncbi:hypothetical protein B0H19DRAFT_1083184 [Mycena capillaripes]|nr:hypothetical protein B0H19DRAFT_1083184 [Mycena capillaripes]